MRGYRPDWPALPVSRRLTPYKRLLRTAPEVQAGLWSGDLILTEIIEETPDIRTLRLRAQTPELPFTFTAGQYVDVSATIDGKHINRAYSISSSSAERRHIDLTIKCEPEGLMSRYLCHDTRLGDALAIRGPLGSFTFTGNEAERVVLIGSGVGVTPLVSMIRSLIDRQWAGEIHALFGFRALSDGLFVDELKRLAEDHPGFHLDLFYTAALGEDGIHQGRITPKAVRHAVPGLKKAMAFVCGPDAMMADMKKGLRLPSRQLRFEEFSPPAKDPSLGGTYVIRFEPEGVEATSQPGENLLEVAERAGVELDYSCRTGTCGLCMGRLKAGTVELIGADALDEEDAGKGYILTCSAFPNSNCILTKS